MHPTLNVALDFSISANILLTKLIEHMKMKRELCDGKLFTIMSSNDHNIAKRSKFIKDEVECEMGFLKLGQDLLFEVLKHADARTVAKAACVSKQWRDTAYDERLWEMLCTSHWADAGYGTEQLRSVVLALGGFRRLHSLCLRPILKSLSSTCSSSQFMPGKDEVHFSLSIMSVQYYEKMNVKLRQFRRF